MEQAIEVWKIFWPESIPRAKYAEALAIAGIALQAATRPAKGAATRPAGEMLTTRDLAIQSGLTTATVIRDLNLGRMPTALHAGRGWLIPLDEARRWLEARRGTAPQVVSASHSSHPAVTTKELAAKVGVPLSTIGYGLERGHLHGVKEGGQWRLPLDAGNMAWASQHRSAKSRPAAPRPAPPAPARLNPEARAAKAARRAEASESPYNNRVNYSATLPAGVESFSARQFGTLVGVSASAVGRFIRLKGLKAKKSKVRDGSPEWQIARADAEAWLKARGQ